MFLKMLHVVLLASVKYLLTIPYARVIGLNFEQSLIAVLIGGVGGFLFFFYLSKSVIKIYFRLQPYLGTFVPYGIKSRIKIYIKKRKEKGLNKKIFSRQSRIIAKIKKTYGLWGIIITTPIILTIPVGAFLLSKYYPKRRFIVGYMLTSIVVWAVVLTTAIQLFPGLVK